MRWMVKCEGLSAETPTENRKLTKRGHEIYTFDSFSIPLNVIF